MDNCIVCKVIKIQAPAYILDENEDVIVFLSHENHPLVVTNRHSDGVNVAQANEPAAHQDVFHFHLHVKPRWHNDTVTLDWDTNKVSPEELEATKNKIKKIALVI